MTPKNQKPEITIDYSQCAKEPISRLGEIQSYGGFIMVLDEVIISYSKNIELFLPLNSTEILHQKVSDVAPELAELLRSVPKDLPLQKTFFQTLGLWIVGFRKIQSGSFHIEFFPQPTHLLDINGLEEEIEYLGRKFHYPAKDRSQFLDDVCHIFQKHLRFDQIFIQVLQDGEIMEIVAEANNGKIEKVLGLHFSSKEIPAQARDLYLKQLLRFKQASHSTPVDLVSDSEEGTDLTYCLLREPSKFMTVYMQNISASTLLSTSIIIEKKLVALLTMHNAEPIFLDPRIFDRLVGVVHRVSLELLRIDDLIAKNADSKLWELLMQDFSLGRLEALQELITSPNLGRSLAHSGAVVAKDGEAVCTVGNFPIGAVLKDIIQKCSSFKETTYYTSKLSEDFGLLATSLGGFAGVMAITFENLSLLFFRKSFPSELKWRNAAPESYELETNLPRFSPAGSFQFLIQEFQNQSRPWSEKDIAFSKVVAKWVTEDFES